MESSFALAGTLQSSSSKGLLVPPTDPKHVFVVSNDGIPEELKDIGAGQIDATVSPARRPLRQVRPVLRQGGIDGKTFQPGKTDHDSTIIQVRPGLLEDQLSAPLVTAGRRHLSAASPAVKIDDKSLWGNNHRLQRRKAHRSDERQHPARPERGRRGPRHDTACRGHPHHRSGTAPRSRCGTSGIVVQAGRDTRAGRTQRRRQVHPGLHPHRPAGPDAGDGRLRRRARAGCSATATAGGGGSPASTRSRPSSRR